MHIIPMYKSTFYSDTILLMPLHEILQEMKTSIQKSFIISAKLKQNGIYSFMSTLITTMFMST